MAKVLRIASDGAGGDALVWKSAGPAVDELYITFDLFIPAAALPDWTSAGFSGTFAAFTQGGDYITIGSELDGIYLNVPGDYAYDKSPFNNITGTGETTDAWHTISMHWKKSQAGAPGVQIDATDYGYLSGTTYGVQTDGAFWGQHAPPSTTEPIYMRNLKLGTSGYGSSDIANIDLSGGSLSVFDDHQGDVSIIDDPTPPPPVSASSGVMVAFAAAALDANPFFTRLDNLPKVSFSTIRVKRGRPDERSKTAIGTATLNGFDMNGTLDPTNAGGPYYGHLDPVKQSQVQLYNPVDAVWSPIFTGYTDEWAYDLDVSEKKIDFQLDLVDMLDMLNDAEIVPDVTGNTVAAESTGDVFYTGQHVDDRLKAVLADSSTAFLAQTFPAALLNIFTGNVNVQGRVYANRTTLLQVIDEACDAEFPGVSNRFVGKDGVFDFRGRYARYNPSLYINGSGNAGTARVAGSKPGLQWYVGDIPAWKIDNTLAVYTGFKFQRGKTNLINAALVTPLGIANPDIAGQFVYDATSIGKYGVRTSGMSMENIITGDANDDGLDALPETKAMGQGTVDNYKNPVTRVSQMVFRNPPAGAPASRAASTWRLLCGIELSDLITVTSTHPGGGGFSAVDFFVEGITYDITPLRGDEWNVTLTLDVSPRAYYNTNPFPHS